MQKGEHEENKIIFGKTFVAKSLVTAYIRRIQGNVKNDQYTSLLTLTKVEVDE